jgi:hypothetical protein
VPSLNLVVEGPGNANTGLLSSPATTERLAPERQVVRGAAQTDRRIPRQAVHLNTPVCRLALGTVRPLPHSDLGLAATGPSETKEPA